MLKAEKERISNLRTISYWSCLGGVEVKDTTYSFADGCYFLHLIVGTFSCRRKFYKVRVQETNPIRKQPRAFVLVQGKRLYLDEAVSCYV